VLHSYDIVDQAFGFKPVMKWLFIGVQLSFMKCTCHLFCLWYCMLL